MKEGRRESGEGQLTAGATQEEKTSDRLEPERREVEFPLASSYPISLEVDENPSSDLGDEDEQQAGEVLQDRGKCLVSRVSKRLN